MPLNDNDLLQIFYISYNLINKKRLNSICAMTGETPFPLFLPTSFYVFIFKPGQKIMIAVTPGQFATRNENVIKCLPNFTTYVPSSQHSFNNFHISLLFCLPRRLKCPPSAGIRYARYQSPHADKQEHC